MKKINISKKAAIAVSAVCAVGMAVAEYGGIRFADDIVLSEIIQMIITRGCGSVMFTFLLLYLGYNVMGMCKSLKALLFTLPCFAVAINNFPIISTISRSAYLSCPTSYIPLFALECLFIGIFEETAFRGTLFLILLEKRRSSTKQIFWVTVISSAVFGFIHIFNILMGAGVGPTIMQVGYSFLIGGMCAFVLLKTKSIWLSAIIHAIYDFCGYLMPKLGNGSWWDTPTIVITTILGVAVFAFVILSTLKIKPEDIDDIFSQADTVNDNNIEV